MSALKVASKLLFIGFVIAVSSILLPNPTRAQDREPVRGLRAGNTYSVSDIENVNMSNGNLMLNIPLASVPGRGTGPSASVTARYNSKLWNTRQEVRTDVDPEYGTKYNQYLRRAGDGGYVEGGWLIDAGTSYLNFTNRQNGEPDVQCNVLGQGPGAYEYGKNAYVYKLEIHMPDGGVKEMRPYGSGAAYEDPYHLGYFSIDTNGRRLTTSYNDREHGGPVCSIDATQVTTSGMNYYSIDGSGVRLYIPYNAGDHWTLYYPDGTVIQNLPSDDTTLIQRVTDRNGNKVVWKPATFNGHSGTEIVNDVGQYVFLYGDETSGNTIIQQPGFDGELLTTTISYRNVWVNRHYLTCLGESGVTATYDNINENVGGIDTITLPSQAGGVHYQFTYHGANTQQTGTNYTDGFGELKTMEMPSGASVAYSFALDDSSLVPVSATEHWWTNAADGVVLENAVKKRELTYDQVYDGTSTPVTETTLYDIVTTLGGSGTSTGPDGGVTTQLPALGVYGQVPAKVTHPDGSVTESTWAQNIAPGVSAWSGVWHLTGTNAYVKTTYNTIPDASGNPSLTAIKDFDYDKNGNVLEVREYDWVTYSSCHSSGTPTGIPSGATLKRKTTNTYYNPTPIATDTTTSDSDIYANPSSPKLHNVIKSTEVKDGSGNINARTEFYYDDASNTGNLTETRSWDSTKGALASPDSYGSRLTSSNSISTYTTYNTYGEPTVIKDADGHETHITYGNVSGPNGNVTDLYPTQTVTAYGTSVARTMQAVYDFYTGVVTTATDVDNSISTVTEYDDLGRPTKVRSAYSTDLEAWTQTTYHDGGPSDHNRYVIVKSDVAGKGYAEKVATQFYDQLGRVRLSKTLEDASTQDPTDEEDGIKVQTRYKIISGYTYQVTSNPYRASTSSGASSEPTMGWTRSKAWATGHESQVETFSGATLPYPFLTSSYNTSSTGIVQTDTDAAATTVTDQAGKVRRSIVNGIGQMMRVDEPNSSGALGTVSSPNQDTNYSYDVLNNLLGVSQGSQTRTFTYSSLSRLLSAANPESGTITYAYDSNGNLTSKVDARTITTSYTYDAQNRVTARNYSDSTPDVTYTYDNKTHAYGKLSKVDNGTSATEYTSFDDVGRVTGHKQTTDSHDYTTGYTYKLNGSLYEETYPSGRMVKNSFESDGDLSQVQTKPSGGSYTNRASNFVYNAAGAVQSLQLGNSKYETTAFNSRLQPTQIGLGNSTTDTSLLRLQYGYGSTANNGNVQSQTITVPNAGTDHGFTATQDYAYDSLNRLQSATESTEDRVNYALSSNGGTATASSEAGAPYFSRNVNNGDRKGVGTGVWVDGTYNSFPDWVEIDFNGTKSVDEIDVFAVQDNYSSPSEPTESMTFSSYGITAFDVQYWNGSSWATVPNGGITSNNKVWRKLTFAPLSTTKIRVVVNNAQEYMSRITELEAWGSGSNFKNYARASNGATATASSTYSGYSTASAIDGDRSVMTGGMWNDNTADGFPDWLQVDFGGSKAISEIDVVTLPDSYWFDPAITETTSAANSGIVDFDVQYWTGSAWATVSGGSVTGNDKAWRKFTFSPVTTSKIRVVVNWTYSTYSRIVELEAWGTEQPTQTWKQEFSYDRYGNRSFVTGSGHTDTLGSCTTMCNPAFSSTTNRITSSGYAFDNSGNTTADPGPTGAGRTFVYDAENKQTSVSNSGGTLGTYQYDGDGKRVRKTVPGGEDTFFIYDAPGKLIGEYAAGTPPTLATEYVYAGSRLLSTETAGPTTTYLTADHLGSPRINTNGSGSVVARHDYMPFGEEIATLQRTTGVGYSGDGGRKKFTGYERDGETGLDFAQARFASANNGRFNSPDPLLRSGRIGDPKTWNRYSYVLNSPIKFVDPTGLYEFVAGTSTKDQEKINKAYQKLVEARDKYKVGSKKYDALNRSIGALGKPGEANGVMVYVNNAQATPGHTDGAYQIGSGDKATGKADVYIGLNLSGVPSDDKSQLATTLGHEGSHAADYQAACASITGMSLEQINAFSAAGNIMSHALSEVAAYRVSSYVAEAISPSSVYNSSYANYEVWNRAWGPADQDANRDAGIRGVLEAGWGPYKYQYSPVAIPINMPGLPNNSVGNARQWTRDGGPLF